MTPAADPPSEVLLAPGPPRPAPRTAERLPAEVRRWRSETMASLGIDPRRQVVATGHQAGIWHAGILAKDVAVAALGQRFDAEPLHFIADHDANDAGLIRLPSGAGEDLRVVTWRSRPAAEGHATRDRAAGPTAPPPELEETVPGLRERIRRIHATIDRHANAPSLAWQLGRASGDLSRALAGEVPRTSMSSLLQSPIGTALLDRIREDPVACARTHDEAVEADRRRRAQGGRMPRGVARLLGRGRTIELPTWTATADGRRPTTIDDDPDPDRLRPRALLATMLARLAGCDLFVHGLGGAVYDRVMEDWATRWLGPEITATLAPTIVASATVRLPVRMPEVADPITAEAFHRLQFDPDLGRSGEPRRWRLLQDIDRQARGSPERRAAFRRLHLEIESARLRGAEAIDDARARLAAQTTAHDRRRIAADRTWAFPIHDDDRLGSLANAIRRQVGE